MFIIYGLYYVEVGSLYAKFLKHFYHKWVLNFVEGSFCIYWDYHIDFTFQFVNMVYHIDWFVCIEEFLHPWNKPNLIMMHELFMCCWILFPRTWLNIFVCVHQWYWPTIFFLCVLHAWFWYQGDCGLVEWVWKYSFLYIFLGKSFRKTGIISSQNTW